MIFWAQRTTCHTRVAVIINIPTPESLNDVALRLHFSVWSSLIEIRSEFDMVFPPDFDPRTSGNGWKEERAEYIEACQPEFQSVLTLIQQSNELALKARICSVSPFLLLLRNERRFSNAPKDVDFSEEWRVG